jgi:hypothetical protein
MYTGGVRIGAMTLVLSIKSLYTILLHLPPSTYVLFFYTMGLIHLFDFRLAKT